MKLATIVCASFVEDHILRQAETDWVAQKHKRKVPHTGDPHPKGGVYLYRSTVQGVREALKFLLNEDVMLGRVVKIGIPDPGQSWLVEVYKPGSNSLAKSKPNDPDDNTYFYAPQGLPQAIVVYQEGDQLSWTGDVYENFETAIVEQAKMVNP